MLYFELETVLKFNNLRAMSCSAKKNKSAHRMLIFFSLTSSGGLDKPSHLCSLARVFMLYYKNIEVTQISN